MHKNMVQRTKLYFILLAVITTISLFFLTLKWGSISQIYKITSHETHVHISQFPAKDSPPQQVSRNLSNQVQTTSKTPKRLRKSNAVTTHRITAVKNAVLNKTKEVKSERALTDKTKKLPLHTPKTNVSKILNDNSKSETRENLKADPSLKAHDLKSLHVQESGKKTTTRSKPTEAHVYSKEISAGTTKTSIKSAGNSRPKVTDKHKDVQNALTVNKSRTASIYQNTDPKVNLGSRIYTKVIPANSYDQTTKQYIVTTERAEVAIKYSLENKADFVSNPRADAYQKDNEIRGNKANIQAVQMKSNNQIKQASSIHKPEETGNNIVTNSSSRQSNEFNAAGQMNNKNILTELEKAEKMTYQKADEKLTRDETEQLSDKTDQYIAKESKLSSDNGKVISQSKTKLGIQPKDDSEAKPERDNSFINNNQHDVQTKNKLTKTEFKSNSNPENMEKSNDIGRQTDAGIDIEEKYESKKKIIEERLKTIKDQLINRTILSDKAKKLTQDEKVSNDKEAENVNKQPDRPRNRYLQQRLRYLGLHKRLPGFNREIDLDEKVLDANGGTARPDTCKSCFKVDFRRTINEESLCRGGNIDILILISTSPQNKDARNAIRKTWGEVCRKDQSRIKCLFVLGNASNDVINNELKEESRSNHDMVQVDFKDSYANLTYKTMTSLKWASEYCSGARFIMKTDDDMFVNTDLLPLLIQQLPEDNFLGGFCWGPSPPHRDMNSKWYVSYNMYRGGSFPSMCSGTGYIISSNIVPKILTASRNIPFFYLEDVYLAICVKQIGLHPTSITGFHNLLEPYSRCGYKNEVITSHQVSPEALTYYWEDRKLCEETRPPERPFYFTDLY